MSNIQDDTDLHKHLADISSSYGGYIGVSDKKMWIAMFEQIEKDVAALVARREALKAKDAWSEGFNAGWAECKDPDAFVNDVWDAKTPNPYAAALTTEATQGGKGQR